MTPTFTDSGEFCRRLTVDAQAERLADVRSFVHEVASEVRLGQERMFDLKVAVSEACANAMEHAGTGACSLEIRATLQMNRLTVEVSDMGFFRPPSLPRSPETRGLGLPLMVALVDELHIARMPQGGTTVRLSMYTDRPAASAAL